MHLTQGTCLQSRSRASMRKKQRAVGQDSLPAKSRAVRGGRIKTNTRRSASSWHLPSTLVVGHTEFLWLSLHSPSLASSSRSAMAGPRYQAKAIFAVQRCMFLARRHAWQACQACQAASVRHERTRRLTLPSRGRSKGCAFCPPLMSNVSRLSAYSRQSST